MADREAAALEAAQKEAHDRLTTWQRIRLYAGGADTIGRFAEAVEAKFWRERAEAAEARVTALEAREAEAKSIMFQSLGALGSHPRGFAQEALIRACEFVAADPADWTSHPDVMHRRRAALSADPEVKEPTS